MLPHSVLCPLLSFPVPCKTPHDVSVRIARTVQERLNLHAFSNKRAILQIHFSSAQLRRRRRLSFVFHDYWHYGLLCYCKYSEMINEEKGESVSKKDGKILTRSNLLQIRCAFATATRYHSKSPTLFISRLFSCSVNIYWNFHYDFINLM